LKIKLIHQRPQQRTKSVGLALDFCWTFVGQSWFMKVQAFEESLAVVEAGAESPLA
jgi:hypothetical protein